MRHGSHGFTALAILFASAAPALADPAPKLEPNIAAVKAAADPANGPTIVEPVWGAGRFHDGKSAGPGGYFPERAERLGVSGGAIIQCKLATGGPLRDCTILAEGPLGFYFGEASLAMAKDGRLMGKPEPDMANEALVRLVVIFKNPNRR